MLNLVEPITVKEEIVPYPAEHSIEVLPSNIDQRLLLFDIPGQGNKTKQGCGHVSHVDACPDCKKVRLHDYHCKNFACPVCYPFASLQGAERAAKKIVGVYSELRKMGIFPGYMNHIVISLPDERLSEFLFTKGKNKGKINYEKLREYFYMLAKIIGISGGELVIHSARCKDELEFGLLVAQELYGEEHPRVWKGIQSNVYDLDDWREYVKFGLHAHITGYFKLPVKEDGTYYTSHDFYNDSAGCVYNNITVEKCKIQKKPVKPENFKSLKAIIGYELGHHAYRKGKNGITPFGIIRDWKKEREGTDYFYEKCKECGIELVQISPLEYENLLADSNSVNLKNKKKVLRSKPVIRYILSEKFRQDYLKKYRVKIAEDKEKVQDEIKEDVEKAKFYLENKRKLRVNEGLPVKKPVREFVPYRVPENNYLTLRIACIYKLKRMGYSVTAKVC